MVEKPWKGRIAGKTAEIVERFTASIEFERRLYRYDIEGSIAHWPMIAKVGIVGAEEADTIIQGLNELSLAKLQNITPPIQPDVFACLQARETIARRSGPGGTAETAVRAAIQAVEKRLGRAA